LAAPGIQRRRFASAQAEGENVVSDERFTVGVIEGKEGDDGPQSGVPGATEAARKAREQAKQGPPKHATITGADVDVSEQPWNEHASVEVDPDAGLD
jgi:hypothetical protein